MQGWLIGCERGMELGADDGYEAGRRDELALLAVAAQYADRVGYSGDLTARDLDRLRRRREQDAGARTPREGDLPAGFTAGVAPWEGDPATAARAEALLAELAALPRVRADTSSAQHDDTGQ